ncbi:MAG: glycosyltransferase, partial [Actinomycetota bacterium]|nr:glycosyltransferase [Actinomycetota bacterium]
DARTGGQAAARKYTSLMLRAWMAARRGRFDAVVGHYLYPTAAIARMAADRARVPLVLVTHGTDVRSVMREDRFGRAGRAALSSADLVVTVSGALERIVREELKLPAAVPTAVINMGIDDELFAPDAHAREKLHIEPGTRVVLYAGNLVPTKGVDVLAEAFFALLDQGLADRLVLVGDGPLAKDIAARVDANAVSFEHADPTDRVTLTGRLHQRDLARWMAAADVFVLPSRAEGLGLVLLEAMACGTPCVGSDVGGIPEVLATPSCGALAPAEDPAALADAIAQVLATGKDSYEAACRAQAASHSANRKAEEMLTAIERVART